VEIQFYGANCLRLMTKRASIIVDDIGDKVTKADDIALFTGSHDAPKAAVKLVIDQPGEYEVSDISIQGVAARAHMDEPGQLSATMFKIIDQDVRVAIVGHVYPELNDEQLEALGIVDVLILPVGGSGYTLDGIGALKLIKKIEPKVVIPTHFADKAVTYEVPQASLEDALKDISMEIKETVPKLKFKAGEFSDVTQLIVLERQ
jgi:L-ascorbate metabolism protein UlaG (beta-lactamase superfamily)